MGENGFTLCLNAEEIEALDRLCNRLQVSAREEAVRYVIKNFECIEKLKDTQEKEISDLKNELCIVREISLKLADALKEISAMGEF